MTNYLDNIKTWDDYREFIQEKAKKNICKKIPDRPSICSAFLVVYER